MEKAILVRGVAAIGFVVGLLLFLMQTHSRGEAPETFRILMDPGVLTLVGGGLMGVSLAAFAASFLKFSRKYKKA